MINIKLWLLWLHELVFGKTEETPLIKMEPSVYRPTDSTIAVFDYLENTSLHNEAYYLNIFLEKNMTHTFIPLLNSLAYIGDKVTVSFVKRDEPIKYPKMSYDSWGIIARDDKGRIFELPLDGRDAIYIMDYEDLMDAFRERYPEIGEDDILIRWATVLTDSYSLWFNMELSCLNE